MSEILQKTLNQFCFNRYTGIRCNYCALRLFKITRDFYQAIQNN